MHHCSLIAPLVALTALVAPGAARAATTSTYTGPPASPHLLTLTNDGDGETFTVTTASGAPAYTFTIKAVNAAIPIPAGTTCTNADGGKTLVCDSAQEIDQLVIDAGGGSDTVNLDSAHYANGFYGAITVDGGPGDDTFTAGPHGALLDSVAGGEGNDTFNGGSDFGDEFTAEPGDDTYRGGTRAVPAGFDPETYQTRHVRDSWHASGANPVNVSLDGVANDADGQGGTDNVTDVEEVKGGPAGDTLTAGTAAVGLFGDDGDDVLTGSPQADTLYGSVGSDVVRAGGGDDTISDGDYDQVLRLATDPAPPAVGNDTIDAGDGNDVITVGDGKDDVVGGAGNDTIYYPRVQTQTFDTQPDYTGVAIKWRPMTVSLDDQPNDGPTGADEGDNVHADIENVDTGEGAGGVVADRSAGLRISQVVPYSDAVVADDTVTGNAASNVITTGFGNDTVDPGTGADIVDLGAGDDTVTAIDKVTDLIDCGKGTDAAAVDIAGTNAPRSDLVTSCETVSGTALGLEGGTLPTAPKVTLGGAGTVKVKTFLKRYTIGVGVTSDQSATATGELTTTRARIAKVGALAIGSGRLTAGTGTRTLKVKVAVRYRKALKRRLRTRKQRRTGIRLRVAVTVTNTSGQATTATRTIKVRG